ncbi:hypothetical protein PV10_05148 [Exophiala mesophila]|uniref:Uncharacterized protein n=1 Tax=Exophiala mesophila TaxID=212818 RepID=A0A0D1Y0H0_EXOME|nr:uncharacterized protein PV10_05148 [Exophiala mesophila]KIV93981.1 hypothetical protein PV10_05148 [Exophiala mesophila]
MDASSQPVEKEKKGLKKLWKKSKDYVRGKLSKRATKTTTTTTSAPVEPTPAPTAPAAETAVPKSNDFPAETSFIEVDDNIEEPPSVAAAAKKPAPVVAPTDESGERSEPEMRFLKAQAIFAKYNLELNEADWDHRPKVPYERVEKNIRMRVRYTCHNCSASFGRDKVCSSCQHRRCKKCTRHPPAKDKTKSSASKAGATQAAPTAKPALACHECQTSFTLGAEECTNCQHTICERCLHDVSVAAEDAPGPSSVEKPTTEPATTAT